MTSPVVQALSEVPAKQLLLCVQHVGVRALASILEAGLGVQLSLTPFLAWKGYETAILVSLSPTQIQSLPG